MSAPEVNPYRVNLDGESTGPEGQYLVWYSGNGLEVDTADSLQEALEDARVHGSSEYSIFDHIEGPVGDVPLDDVRRWLDKRDREESDRWRARRDAERGKVRYHVAVRGLDGRREASYETTLSRTAAFSYARDLNLPGRVRIYSTVEGGMGSWNPKNHTPVLEYGDAIPDVEVEWKPIPRKGERS